MESIFGIYEPSGGYGDRLADYINSRKDLAYRGVCFHNSSELDDFLTSKDISLLLTDDPDIKVQYQDRIKVVFLSSEKDEIEAVDDDSGPVFKYLKASSLISSIIQRPGQEQYKDFEPSHSKTSILSVFSPSSNESSFEYAQRRKTEYSKVSKTLFLVMDPFCKNPSCFPEKEITLTEFLFAKRKSPSAIRKLFFEMSQKDDCDCISAPEYYEDLWELTETEAEELIKTCIEYGQYERIVIHIGAMMPSSIKLLELSDEIELMKGQNTSFYEEFLRQMKYAGKQEILSKIREVAT